MAESLSRESAVNLIKLSLNSSLEWLGVVESLAQQRLEQVTRDRSHALQQTSLQQREYNAPAISVALSAETDIATSADKSTSQDQSTETQKNERHRSSPNKRGQKQVATRHIDSRVPSPVATVLSEASNGPAVDTVKYATLTIHDIPPTDDVTPVVVVTKRLNSISSPSEHTEMSTVPKQSTSLTALLYGNSTSNDAKDDTTTTKHTPTKTAPLPNNSNHSTNSLKALFGLRKTQFPRLGDIRSVGQTLHQATSTITTPKLAIANPLTTKLAQLSSTVNADHRTSYPNENALAPTTTTATTTTTTASSLLSSKNQTSIELKSQESPKSQQNLHKKQSLTSESTVTSVIAPNILASSDNTNVHSAPVLPKQKAVQSNSDVDRIKNALNKLRPIRSVQYISNSIISTAPTSLSLLSPTNWKPDKANSTIESNATAINLLTSVTDTSFLNNAYVNPIVDVPQAIVPVRSSLSLSLEQDSILSLNPIPLNEAISLESPNAALSQLPSLGDAQNENRTIAPLDLYLVKPRVNNRSAFSINLRGGGTPTAKKSRTSVTSQLVDMELEASSSPSQVADKDRRSASSIMSIEKTNVREQDASLEALEKEIVEMEVDTQDQIDQLSLDNSNVIDVHDVMIDIEPVAEMDSKVSSSSPDLVSVQPDTLLQDQPVSSDTTEAAVYLPAPGELKIKGMTTNKEVRVSLRRGVKKVQVDTDKEAHKTMVTTTTVTTLVTANVGNLTKSSRAVPLSKPAKPKFPIKALEAAAKQRQDEEEKQKQKQQRLKDNRVNVPPTFSQTKGGKLTVPVLQVSVASTADATQQRNQISELDTAKPKVKRKLDQTAFVEIVSAIPRPQKTQKTVKEPPPVSKQPTTAKPAKKLAINLQMMTDNGRPTVPITPQRHVAVGSVPMSISASARFGGSTSATPTTGRSPKLNSTTAQPKQLMSLFSPRAELRGNDDFEIRSDELEGEDILGMPRQLPEWAQSPALRQTLAVQGTQSPGNIFGDVTTRMSRDILGPVWKQRTKDVTMQQLGPEEKKEYQEFMMHWRAKQS